MLRQSATPIQFDRTRRPDNRNVRTTGPAGVVIPVSVAPMLRGDSGSGRIQLSMELAEMPKPLENAVIGRAQAWFVPRPALPQFVGLDEYTHAFHGKTPTALGSTPVVPSLFETVGTGAIAAAQSSEFFKALGISLQASTAINTDYIDAYNLVQNFRLAAHSSKMTRYDYYSEDAVTSLELKPAFWPRNRMHDMVPDYEQALVKGSLDLDVSAGELPLSGFGHSSAITASSTSVNKVDGTGGTFTASWTNGSNIFYDDLNGEPYAYADMAGQTVATTLADIDKARTTQAFAKAMTAYAGTNYSGFNNDDVIVSELMQGFNVPSELFNRPWLLDSKTVVFGMNERHATDAANLDDSVTTGNAGVSLSINVPRQEYGGIIIVTVEVMPERLYERQSDEYLYCTDVDDLPNALRDIQRTEPVDTVLNRRIDTLHSTPNGQYGYEPMNAKWRREFTVLGGEFRQLTPGTPSTTARTAIWQADYVDPAFTDDQWLCPHPFPQGVFSAPSNDIVNITVQHQIAVAGITQFGDDLVEDNGEFLAVEAEQV
jgi:hypothetical protein